MSQITILIVDDTQTHREAINQIIEKIRPDARILEATTTRQGRRTVADYCNDIDIIVCDGAIDIDSDGILDATTSMIRYWRYIKFTGFIIANSGCLPINPHLVRAGANVQVQKKNRIEELIRNHLNLE